MSIKIKYTDGKGLYQDASGPGFLISSSSNGGKFICNQDWGIGVENFLAKMKIRNNDANMDCVIIDQNMSGTALKVDGTHTNIGASDVVYINGSGGTYHTLYAKNALNSGMLKSMIKFEATNVGFNKPVLEVNQVGSGPIVDFLDNSATIFAVSGSGNVHLSAGSASGTDLVIDSNLHIKRKSSDLRLKENILPITNALEMVNNLNGKYFNFKSDKIKTRKVGLIAQEVETVAPELTDTNPDGYKTVHYSDSVALLIEAVKELTLEIEQLKTKIKLLEKE